MRQVLFSMEVSVHKGTEFTGHETLSLSIEYRVLRRELVNEGYIKNNVFVKDYVFNDKREAAIALLGRMVSRKAAKTLGMQEIQRLR